MAYTYPEFLSLLDRYLRDVRNLRSQAHIDADSDHYIRGACVSSAAEGLYDHQAWIARQIMPDTADPEYIEMHAALRGLTLKAATFASGTISLSGEPGSEALSGLTAKIDGTEILVVTTSGGTLDANGSLSVACRASAPGVCPDFEAAHALLQSPPSGVNAVCQITLTGGTNASTHAELLAELLYYMRNPPGGGNRFDYVRWAMEVPGVTGAWCYPARRGLGTVDIVIVSAGGLPSPEVLAAAQAHIDTERPVACPDARVFAPVPLSIGVTAALRLAAGYTLPGLQSQAETLLAQYFAGVEPGGEVVHVRMEALLLSMPGVVDVQITAPAGNIQAGALEWPRLGGVNLEEI